jgi:hypothetical protein
MAHDGTGTGWSITSPADSEPSHPDGAKEIRDLRKGIAIRMNKEHTTLATASAGGDHKAGSARAYLAANLAAVPTTKPDGATALDANDTGRLMIRTDTGKIKYWNGTEWVTVTPTIALADLPAFTSSKAANGYVTLPGGIIIQWGKAVEGAEGQVVVTFPTAFPTACYSITVGVQGDAADDDWAASIASFTTSGATFNLMYIGDGTGHTGTSTGIYWMAIGC